MFSFYSISRRQYSSAMIIAIGSLIVVVANFAQFMNIVTLVIDCNLRGDVCLFLESRVPEYVSAFAITLFLTVAAIATFRRVKETPVSNYWVVFLSVLIFLDHPYLAGLSRVWVENSGLGLFEASLPWYLLAAVSLVVLLCAVPDRSAYFQGGFWSADPPLGYGLAISSFWLLSFSGARALNMIANAVNNQSLALTSLNVQHQIEQMLPAMLVSPVVPSVIFVTCAVLLAVMGFLKGEDLQQDMQMEHQRLNAATLTTRAAQNFILRNSD